MGQVVSYKEKVSTVTQLLNQKRAAFAEVLPKYLSTDRLFRTAVNCISLNPALTKCTTVSLLRAVMASAQHGLELGGAMGEAYLVPYGTEAKFMIGYRGLIKMALNSGKVKYVEACEVYENDYFKYKKGTSSFLDHTPTEGDRGEITNFYAMATLENGMQPFEVMKKLDVDAIRKRSKSGRSGPWVTDYVMMGRKTVIRRLSTYLPLSSDIIEQIKNEELVDLGIRPASTLNSNSAALDDIIDCDFDDITDEPETKSKVRATTIED